MGLNDVTINIYGQEYTLKTSAKPEYYEKVAEYVNGKMKEIEDAGIASGSQLRIAILASMNITSELFECKHKKDQMIDKVEAKALAISEFIEDKISDIESSNKD